MVANAFSTFSSIFGFVVAALSLLALFINVCRAHLPSHRIKVLESLLDETETCFRKAVEDGLLTELSFVHRTERRLAKLRIQIHGLQSRAYSATNLHQDYIAFFRGTSIAIGTACQTLRKLKYQVILSSEQGRCRLEETRFSNPFPASPPISRPHSCPPALANQRLADTSGVTAQIKVASMLTDAPWSLELERFIDR